MANNVPPSQENPISPFRLIGAAQAVGQMVGRAEVSVASPTVRELLESGCMTELRGGSSVSVTSPIMPGEQRGDVLPGLLAVVGTGEEKGGSLVAIVGRYDVSNPTGIGSQLMDVSVIRLPLAGHDVGDGQSRTGRMLGSIDVAGLNKPGSDGVIPGLGTVVIGREDLGGDPFISGKQFSVLVDRYGGVCIADGDTANNGKVGKQSTNGTAVLTSEHTRNPQSKITDLYNVLADNKHMWDTGLAIDYPNALYVDPQAKPQ